MPLLCGLTGLPPHLRKCTTHLQSHHSWPLLRNFHGIHSFGCTSVFSPGRYLWEVHVELLINVRNLTRVRYLLHVCTAAQVDRLDDDRSTQRLAASVIGGLDSLSLELLSLLYRLHNWLRWTVVKLFTRFCENCHTYSKQFVPTTWVQF